MTHLVQNKTKGFTLVELLVVITIIGLLASTVLAAMSSARDSARDATRVSTVKELQKALELYRNANGGDYPCATVACTAGASNPGAQVITNGSVRSAIFDGIISPYLVMPDEAIAFPGNTTWGSIMYRVGGTVVNPVRDSYTILFRREQSVIKSDGTVINANAWCDIRVGANANTVNWPDATYPDCF